MLSPGASAVMIPFSILATDGLDEYHVSNSGSISLIKWVENIAPAFTLVSSPSPSLVFSGVSLRRWRALKGRGDAVNVISSIYHPFPEPLLLL